MNIMIPNCLMGFGVGLSMIPIINLSLDTLKNEQMTNASGIQNLLKNIGGAIGTSLVATMLTRYAQVHQYMLVRNLTDLNPNYIERVQATAGALSGGYCASPAHVSSATGNFVISFFAPLKITPMIPFLLDKARKVLE